MENEREEYIKKELTISEKKKWARLKLSAELGLWLVKDVDCLFVVTLTTWSKAVVVRDKGGRKGISRNSWKQMSLDLRKFRYNMKKLGYVYEDWFVCEVSPRSKLLHLHGFMRFEIRQNEKEIGRVVSEQWEKVHFSPEVDVRSAWNLRGALNYDVKHTMKSFIGECTGENRELFISSSNVQGERKFHVGKGVTHSKGWLPRGWKEVLRQLRLWALSVTDVWVDEEGWGDDGNWYPERSDKEYVAYKWAVMNSEYRRWCQGEDIELKYDNKYVVISGDCIYECEYEEE
jgi:hypothetical protein